MGKVYKIDKNKSPHLTFKERITQLNTYQNSLSNIYHLKATVTYLVGIVFLHSRLPTRVVKKCDFRLLRLMFNFGIYILIIIKVSMF